MGEVLVAVETDAGTMLVCSKYTGGISSDRCCTAVLAGINLLLTAAYEPAACTHKQHPAPSLGSRLSVCIETFCIEMLTTACCFLPAAAGASLSMLCCAPGPLVPA